MSVPDPDDFEMWQDKYDDPYLACPVRGCLPVDFPIDLYGPTIRQARELAQRHVAECHAVSPVIA